MYKENVLFLTIRRKVGNRYIVGLGLIYSFRFRINFYPISGLLNVKKGNSMLTIVFFILQSFIFGVCRLIRAYLHMHISIFFFCKYKNIH